MAHLTVQQQRDAAVFHAEQAHALLLEAKAAYDESVKKVGATDRDLLRVRMAMAHAFTASALSTLLLPLGPPPPA